MMKFANEDVFNKYVKESHLTNLATLVEELAEIKENLSGNDASKLDSITIPHYLVTLNAFKNRGRSKMNLLIFSINSGVVKILSFSLCAVNPMGVEVHFILLK